jgi:hypothetical protein
MVRKTILVWCFLAMGCASVAERDRLAAAEPTQAAAELECMSDCLGEADASCEDCASRCFSAPAGVTLSFSR